MQCTQCGKELAPTAKFCTKCRTSVVQQGQIPDMGSKAPELKHEYTKGKVRKFVLMAARILIVAGAAGKGVWILKLKIEEALKGIAGGYEAELPEELDSERLKEPEHEVANRDLIVKYEGQKGYW